jgi:hypothetical protein
VERDDDQEEDGMQRAMSQEYLMTRDPGLNVAPTERLLEARKRIDELDASSSRTTNANATTSLSWQEEALITLVEEQNNSY